MYRCELLGRTCLQLIVASFWEGPSVNGPAAGGQLRSFGKDVPSVNRYELSGRTCCRWTLASLWEAPAFSV
jgi:hypothetical protein